MPAELFSTGRTRQITGNLYLERWIQLDAGTSQIYDPTTGDLNVLDSLADSRTAASSGPKWYGAPSPGAQDPGKTISTWYGIEIRVPFKFFQPSGAWGDLKAELQSFVEEAFPNEIILEMNRRLEAKPNPTTQPDPPAKFILWYIEHE